MPVPCVLNPLDANLGVSICDQLTACTRSDGGWCYTWSGVRGTVGVSAGTYRYTVRVLRSLPVELPQHPDGPASYPAVRVGVSFPTTDVGMLGEAPGSWAFSSTGSVAGDGGEPAVYARELVPGDEVRAAVSLLMPCSAACYQAADTKQRSRPYSEYRIRPRIFWTCSTESACIREHPGFAHDCTIAGCLGR